MIAALDTNILLPDAPRLSASRQTLAEASRAGALVISEPVYAELAAHFPSVSELDRFLTDTAIRVETSSTRTLPEAGRAWREYRGRRPAGLACPQCGNVQACHCARCAAGITIHQHIMTDFMIGAHALVQADRLLTRDRGYYRTYLPGLLLAS